MHAIDSIAQQEGFSAGLLTLTMPPEFHPNPMKGPSVWNDSLPLETNRELAQAWQKVLQRLDRVKIGITGLRVVEPHQDACPHWHVWINYKPEFEKRILSAVMSEFPCQLKLRTSSGTLIYNDVLDFEGDVCVSDPDTQASSRVDFAVIDRRISSGATYLMKYLLKTMNVGSLDKKELTQDVLDLIDQFDQGDAGVNASQNSSFDWEDDPATQQAYFMERSDLDDITPPADFKLDSFENSQRVDAYRSVWGFRAFDFFGLTRCLGTWDELRKLGTKPANPHLAMLWSYARGGEVEGRIEAGSKIQGKAVEFIRALGCMRAVNYEPAGPYFKVGLLRQPRLNQYGEETEEVVGLILFEVKKQHVKANITDKATGLVKQRNRLKWVKTEITSLVTKTKRWALVCAAKLKTSTISKPQPKQNSGPMRLLGLNSNQPVPKEHRHAESITDLERMLDKALAARVINKSLHLKILALYKIRRGSTATVSNS